jgi:hypothetical protein
MFNAIGTFWFNFYLKKVRAPFFGLTPLQQYIVDRNDKRQDENPLLTYFYFLTYEKEVMDRIQVQKDNNQDADEVYQEIKNALMGARQQGELENTTHKMLVHMLSLVFIVTLMISASAVSTGKLMGLWGESFGPYAYLMQGFFFATASFAQWMIYRKTVPEVLKKLLSGREGWHFNKRLVLAITNNGLVNNGVTPDNYSKVGLAFFMFCGALLSISLGMIVLDTSAGTVEEGNVFLSMTAINGIAQAFGGVSNLGWLLCIASIACNFALFVNGSMNYLFKRADAAAEAANNLNPEQTKSWSWTKVGAVAALVSLVVLNFFGLTTTVMSQAQSTLRVSTGDSVDPDSTLSLVFNPVFTFIAGICGRGLFNICAMENLRVLLSEMWMYRAEMWEECKHDIRTNIGTYSLGLICTVAVGVVFGLNTIDVFGNAGSILPVVATLGAAIGVFSLFKMGSNYVNHQVTGICDHEPLLNQSFERTGCETKQTFTLMRDSERRSGKELFMILGNSVGAGALAMSSVSAFLAYSTKDSDELKTLKLALTIFAFLGGGLMSMGSAVSRVNAEVTKPVNKSVLTF